MPPQLFTTCVGTSTSDRIGRLIVYEPSIDDDPEFPGVVARVAELVRRGEDEQAAVTLLVERSGVPPDAVDAVRELPQWPILLRGVQALPREGAARLLVSPAKRERLLCALHARGSSEAGPGIVAVEVLVCAARRSQV